MSALDKLIQKESAQLTYIEYAIRCAMWDGRDVVAESAADELEQINAELSALRARVAELEGVSRKLIGLAYGFKDEDWIF